MTPARPTQESMAALLALAEKATPGPWTWTPMEWECFGHEWDEDGETQSEEHTTECSPSSGAWLPLFKIDCGDYHGIGDDDAAYIAAASPEVVAGLVAEIARLREALRGAEKWAHVLDRGMGLPDDESNGFASMTPKAARGHRWHASMCPGCAARKALAEDR